MECLLQTITGMPCSRFALHAVSCRVPGFLGFLGLVGVLGLVGCRDADGQQQTRLRPAPVAPAKDAPKVIDNLGPHPADTRVNVLDLQDAKAQKAKQGDQADAEWVAKEFSSGMSRWRDVGVYIDGKPVGFLSWGELPLACKASWLKEKVSADMRAGTNDPGWKLARKRYYKFTDYLKAVHVDPRKIKELHVLGPHPSETLIVTGRDLQTPAANELWFTFGANTSGKPIPHSPEHLGNGKVGDKINGVMIYINKKPPTLVENEGLFLDGVPQTGVPYYGEPVRGGVRVYLDDQLATIIKRQELDPKKATKASDGSPMWRLAEFLSEHGVDTKHVVEMWTIREEIRSEKFSGAELATMTFQANSQAKGGVLLGDKLVRASVIALHTRSLTPDDLPVPEQPDE